MPSFMVGDFDSMSREYSIEGYQEDFAVIWDQVWALDDAAFSKIDFGSQLSIEDQISLLHHEKSSADEKNVD